MYAQHGQPSSPALPPARSEAAEQAERELRRMLVPVGIISGFVNLLMLTSPMYMLQVYDRVLMSRNVTTLLMLTILAASLMAVGSYLDHVRNRVAARLAIRFERRLSVAAFAAELDSQARGPTAPKPVNDLETIRQFMFGPGLGALFDTPWVPAFVMLLAILHPVLGLTAAIAVLLLLANGLIFSFLAGRRNEGGTDASRRSHGFLNAAMSQRDAVMAMNMTGDIGRRWHEKRLDGLGKLVEGGDFASLQNSVGQFIRQIAQMAMLGLGAYLAVADQITPGLIVAGSIICGRALAPIDKARQHMKTGREALAAFRRLRQSTAEAAVLATVTPMPRPFGPLIVDHVSVVYPGQKRPALRDISFSLEPGDSLGVVGPSGAGKSTLARLLVGAWAPNAGSVTVDGHDLHHDHGWRICSHIGYVAQRLSMIEGSVLDNISRFQADSREAAVLAADRIGIHTVIERLPWAYDTPVAEAARRLTPIQLRVLEFARAIYGDPAVIVLDKADAGLDAFGNECLAALMHWARRDGRILVMASDRPAIVRHLDRLMLLSDGGMEGIISPDQMIGRIRDAQSRIGHVA